MWVRLDDRFYRHPKVLKAGPMAAWLCVCGLSYSAEYLTDGFIPSEVVPELARFERPMELAARLVEVGLWEQSVDGFLIHDYLDWNPKAEKVREKRTKDAQRLARWRDGHKDENGHAKRYENERVTPLHGRYTAASNAAPVPVPVPNNTGANAPGAKAPQSRRKDGGPTVPAEKVRPVFAVLARRCGLDLKKLTDGERGELNKAAVQLVRASYGPEEVNVMADNYPEHFENCVMTPSAIANHPTLLYQKPAPKQRTPKTGTTVHPGYRTAEEYEREHPEYAKRS